MEAADTLTSMHACMHAHMMLMCSDTSNCLRLTSPFTWDMLHSSQRRCVCLHRGAKRRCVHVCMYACMHLQTSSLKCIPKQ